MSAAPRSRAQLPLSFDWDAEALLMATPMDSPAGRSLADTRAVRLGLGHTRDVSMIEGAVEVLESRSMRWCRSGVTVSPYREVNEMPDRELMRDGRWLV